MSETLESELMLTVIVLTAVGAVAGEWLARRPPVNRERVFCACAALVGAVFTMTRPTSGPDLRYVTMGLAVVVSGFLVASLLRRWWHE